MAHENTALFHLNRRHTTQNDHTQHCAHKPKECKTSDISNRRLGPTAANYHLESKDISLISVGGNSAMNEAVKLCSWSADGRRRSSRNKLLLWFAAIDKAGKPVAFIQVSTGWMLTFSCTRTDWKITTASCPRGQPGKYLCCRCTCPLLLLML